MALNLSCLHDLERLFHQIQAPCKTADFAEPEVAVSVRLCFLFLSLSSPGDRFWGTGTSWQWLTQVTWPFWHMMRWRRDCKSTSTSRAGMASSLLSIMLLSVISDTSRYVSIVQAQRGGFVHNGMRIWVNQKCESTAHSWLDMRNTASTYSAGFRGGSMWK